MKIIICGSMSAYREMSNIKKVLEKMGHFVQMPSLNNLDKELDTEGNTVEISNIKIEQDLIRKYFKKIKKSDAILVINTEKNNISGYIGGNTFLEIGFGHVQDKKLFILNSYSKEIPYYDEIDAMQPTVLNGDISLIK
jgi:hypothetical protein